MPVAIESDPACQVFMSGLTRLLQPHLLDYTLTDLIQVYASVSCLRVCRWLFLIPARPLCRIMSFVGQGRNLLVLRPCDRADARNGRYDELLRHTRTRHHLDGGTVFVPIVLNGMMKHGHSSACIPTETFICYDLRVITILVIVRKRSTSINAPSSPALPGCPLSNGRWRLCLTGTRRSFVNASKKPAMFFGIPKLPSRYGAFVMPLLLSIFMTCIVSLISTLKGIGPSPQFVSKWLGAWGISWLIAFPVLLLALPIVRKMTTAIVRTS